MSSAGEFEALLADLSKVRPAAEPRDQSPVRSVAVLGAGPVGQALACEFLAAECEVTLYAAFEPERPALAAPGAVTVRGEHLVGTYRLAGEDSSSQPAIRLRAGVDDAVTEADAILIATPAVAHAACGGLLAGRLREDQLVVLVPGRLFGAVELARSLRRFAAPVIPTIVELAAAPYEAQAPRPGALTVDGVSREVLAAALPNRRTDGAILRLRTVLPMLTAGRGVLHTGFSELSGVLDAAPALLREPASAVRRIDEERRRIAFAYGVRDLAPAPAGDDAAPAGDDAAPEGDHMAAAPDGSDSRVHDALCCSLVPLVSAGALAGLPARTAAALVDLASVQRGLDYMRHGRTLAGLGLDRFAADEIRRALDGGDAMLLGQALT